MQKLCVLAAALVLSLFSLIAQAVNINSANADELSEALTGVGQSKAEAIVAYRDEHGPFKTVDELVKVKGIGLATLEKNREKLELGPTSSKPAASAKPD